MLPWESSTKMEVHLFVESIEPYEAVGKGAVDYSQLQ
jgi:hypothetical protein